VTKKVKTRQTGAEHRSEFVVVRAPPRDETSLRRHPLSPLDVLKLATLNINEIHTPSRVVMLYDFLRYHDIDILFLQVTHHDIGDLPGYVTHTNVGTTMRGTAFVTRNELPVTNVINIPTGTGKASDCLGITLINVYVPSGKAKQAERESFKSDLVYLFRNAPEKLLLGGDFNCVLEASVATGTAEL